jgi:hypothetical protein
LTQVDQVVPNCYYLKHYIRKQDLLIIWLTNALSFTVPKWSQQAASTVHYVLFVYWQKLETIRLFQCLIDFYVSFINCTFTNNFQKKTFSHNGLIIDYRHSKFFSIKKAAGIFVETCSTLKTAFTYYIIFYRWPNYFWNTYNNVYAFIVTKSFSCQSTNHFAHFHICIVHFM